MGRLIGWIATLAIEVLVGMGLQRLVSSVIGLEAPWWAWTIIISVMWRVLALITYLEAMEKTNLARFEALSKALDSVQSQPATYTGQYKP